MCDNNGNGTTGQCLVVPGGPMLEHRAEEVGALGDFEEGYRQDSAISSETSTTRSLSSTPWVLIASSNIEMQ